MINLLMVAKFELLILFFEVSESLVVIEQFWVVKLFFIMFFEFKLLLVLLVFLILQVFEHLCQCQTVAFQHQDLTQEPREISKLFLHLDF